nr:hypothetical protein [Mesorhizobium amorphae]
MESLKSRNLSFLAGDPMDNLLKAHNQCGSVAVMRRTPPQQVRGAAWWSRRLRRVTARRSGRGLLGRAERRLGIDDPVLATKLPDRGREGMSLTAPVERAAEAQSPSRIGRLEPLDILVN